jgi:zinc protease
MKQLRSKMTIALLFISSIQGLLFAQTKPSPTKAAATANAFDRQRFAIPYQKYVLSNGLTLLVHEDHSVPVVGVNFWYHVGSRNETRGKTGFAHLFEHFFFNGSENYPHGFREAMDDLGANNRNGTTNNDRTNFFEDVPTSALERTLYLEADRMGFLYGRISKEMLERERGVVQNEKRQGDNQPYAKAFYEVAARMYPYSHPYSWTTIGSMDDLNAASLDDVKNWYKTYYGPNNVVMSLAGDISPEQALTLVKKYFGDIPPGPALVRTERWIPQLDRNIRDEMQDRVPQTQIFRVYHAPVWKDKEITYLRLASDVLAGAKTARLNKVLIDEKKLATEVGAFAEDGELAGAFYINVMVKDGVDPLLAEKEMDAVVNEFLQNGPTKEELQRTNAQIQAAFIRGKERLGGFGGRSDVLAESMTYGGKPDFYLDRLEWMAKAQPQDVKRAAQQWLTAHHYTMVVKPYPALKEEKQVVDRSVLPALGPAPEVSFPAIQTATLKNGLKVMLLERHGVPVTHVTMAVDAGYSSDQPAKAGLASLALDLLKEGTTTRTAYQLSNALDLLGATVNNFSQLDLSAVRLDVPSQNLNAALKLYADMVLRPAFPQTEFETQKQLRLSNIQQEKVQPVAMAQRIVPLLLYGTGHSYSMPLTGSGFEQTVRRFTAADVKQWHQSWFKANNATLIVTGDVRLETLLPMLEENFGNWATGAVPAKNISAVQKGSGGKVYLLDKPEAPQSVIVAAHVTEQSGQPEDIAIQPVMQNFGGMATSRLNRNLRLDKHWSYGTSGFVMNARGQRPFMVIAPVQTDKTKESILEVSKEIKGVAGERPLAGEEFASIMRNMTLRLPARFSTLASLDAAALEVVNYKLPLDYWSKYATNVRSLTEQQLNEAAKKFVRPNEVVWLIVGDRKKIESGIKELNLGELTYIDADGTITAQ